METHLMLGRETVLFFLGHSKLQKQKIFPTGLEKVCDFADSHK